MELLKNIIGCALLAGVIFGCKEHHSIAQTDSGQQTAKSAMSIADLKKKLNDQGYQTFDYIDDKTRDTILMQQYFIAFLKEDLKDLNLKPKLIASNPCTLLI